jgi:hypothetical protein
MKKLMQFSMLAICCLGLFGCPYESQVPISSPTVPVDVRFLGKWSSKDEVYNTYTVTKATETEYKILQQNISNTAKYTGFLSEVKGSTFMNLQSDSTGAYYLYRVKMDPKGNRFVFVPLAENLPDHFGSMDGLKNYLEKNMNFQSLYNEEDKAEFEKLPDNSTAFN